MIGFAALVAILAIGCGGDDDDDDDDIGGIDAQSGAIDAPPQAGEPCDWTNPGIVALDVPVTSDPPTAACVGAVHFYRFTPATTGVYSITKTGGGSVGFCDTEMDGGCICGVNINCCSDCTLMFDLPGGDPLPAGSNNQIYVTSDLTPDPYTFTVTGPI